MEMDKNQIKHVSLRIDMELLAKFRFISKYYDRSINNQITHLIREHVGRFEIEVGPIELEDLWRL